MKDIRVAADMTDRVIDTCNAPEKHTEYGKDHLHEMCHKIINGEITGDKAHRWLGWVQACVCIYGGATMDQFKIINKRDLVV